MKTFSHHFSCTAIYNSSISHMQMQFNYLTLMGFKNVVVFPFFQCMIFFLYVYTILYVVYNVNVPHSYIGVKKKTFNYARF